MTKRTEQFAQIADLADAVFDGTADADSRARLETLLLESEAARAFYLDYTALHADTAWERRDNTAAPAANTPDAEHKRSVGIAPAPVSAAGAPIYRKGHEPQPFRFRPHHFAIAGIAATLLAACGFAIYLLAFNAPTTPDPDPDPTKPGPSVATLIHNTGNLRTPADFPVEGESSGAGEYTLSGGGTAEFMLTNSVNVKLRGKTRMVMHNDMNVSLTRGSAEFVVPKDAKGYTVHLPDEARVIDLGTRFRVIINANGSYVTQVLEGSVEWRSPNDDSPTVPLGPDDPIRVVDGRVERLVVLGPNRRAVSLTASLDEGFDEPKAPQLTRIDDLDTPWVEIAKNRALRTIASDGETFPSPPACINFTGSESAGAGLMRAVATKPGVKYELTFYLAKYGTGNPLLDVDVSDGLVTKIEPGSLRHRRFKIDWAVGPWQQRTVRFIAQSAVTTIRFTEPVESPTRAVAPRLDSIKLREITIPTPPTPETATPTPQVETTEPTIE